MIASLVLSILLVTVPCGQRSDVIQSLMETRGESVVSNGISSEGHIVETLVNKETGTWSIILTKPMLPTCIVADGDNWREAEEGSDA